MRTRSLALFVALLLSTAGLVAGCSSDTSIRPPSPDGDGQDGRQAAAVSLVEELQQALGDADPSAAGAVAVGAARGDLAQAAANVRRLGLTGITLRFVDDRATEADDLAEYGADAWRGTVEVGYRLDEWDRGRTTVETPMVFVPAGDGVKVAAVGGADGRTPLWLRGRVSRISTDRALVLARGEDVRRYRPLVRRALSDVGQVLPDWRGRLVLEVPGSEQELDEALDASQEQYANIAAVTASVDGSLTPGSPVHVFLNPRVFDRLGPRGSQVVLSHESTHIATDATFASMPTWLLEGFADYVALAHAGIPVRTAASQILARVRKQGAPRRLPISADLDPTATGLGATYEEAWLATRFVAQQYGEAKLVAFYRAVDGGTPVGAAFRSVLGSTQSAFVRRWSADVDALAGGEPG